MTETATLHKPEDEGEIRTLHVPFAKFLRDSKIPFINSRSDMESTIAAGSPDFCVLCRNAALHIEFKTKDGVLSRPQKQRIAELDAAGNKVHVIRDLDAAIELTHAWLSTLKEPITQSKERKIHKIGSAFYEEKDGQLNRISLNQ